MRLDDLIIEKFIERRPAIALNPARVEYKSILANLDAPWRRGKRDHSDEFPIRGLLDIQNNNLYIWDSYDATHGAIIDRYGIQQGIHLMIKDNHVRVLTLWRYERMGYTFEEIENIVNTNPYLNRILNKEFEIVIEP